MESEDDERLAVPGLILHLVLCQGYPRRFDRTILAELARRGRRNERHRVDWNRPQASRRLSVLDIGPQKRHHWRRRRA